MFSFAINANARPFTLPEVDLTANIGQQAAHFPLAPDYDTSHFTLPKIDFDYNTSALKSSIQWTSVTFPPKG